jgi:hypothetical protein
MQKMDFLNCWAFILQVSWGFTAQGKSITETFQNVPAVLSTAGAARAGAGKVNASDSF